MMFRILNDQAPKYLSDKFSYPEHSYNTRQSSLNVNIMRPNSDSGKRTFLFRGAHVWNSMPENIRLVNNVNSFKRGLSQRKDT